MKTHNDEEVVKMEAYLKFFAEYAANRKMQQNKTRKSASDKSASPPTIKRKPK